MVAGIDDDIEEIDHHGVSLLKDIPASPWAERPNNVRFGPLTLRGAPSFGDKISEWWKAIKRLPQDLDEAVGPGD